MGDVVHMPSSDIRNGRPKETLTKSYVAPPPPLVASTRGSKHLTFPRLKEGHFSQVVIFLLKVGALELVRRFSRSKSPFLWRALQSLQLLIYPPFKWILKWGPLKNLIEGIRVFSRPMIFLSVVTTFLDLHQSSKKISNSKDDCSPSPSSPTTSETSEWRIVGDALQSSMDKLRTQLLEELQEDGVISPDRINDMEIQNFSTAANGDYSSLKKSLSKTIQWRESFGFLSSQELEMWSHLVFWHGRSVNLQPCLVVRLGLAFSSLAPHDRPCFVQAVVSQLEHGVQHLIEADDPKITALLDCDGLASMKFPMQMMRSCATVMQDHYPNRLASLFVTRLPPSTIAIAEAFIQNLKPTTQKKVQILGETDLNILAEFLQSVPSFLGSSCTCVKCGKLRASSQVLNGECSSKKLSRGMSDGQITRFPCPDTMSASYSNHDCEQVLRTAVISILLLWTFLVFFIGMQDPDSFVRS